MLAVIKGHLSQAQGPMAQHTSRAGRAIHPIQGAQKHHWYWDIIFRMIKYLDGIAEKDMLRTDRTLDFYSSEDGNLQIIYNILMSYSMFNFDLGNTLLCL